MNYRQFYGLMNLVEEELLRREDRIGRRVFNDYWGFRTAHKDAIMRQEEESEVSFTLQEAFQPFLAWYRKQTKQDG